jgi:hypothetical protein
VGLSSPNIRLTNSPQIGAVAKMRPVLAALVMLTPKVKAVWPIATPRHPRPATRRRSFGLSLSAGSRMRRRQIIKIPPVVKRKATMSRGGMNSAAYFVAA